MEAVLRAVAMYLFLLLVFRLAGRRTLAQLTSFDFVLMLIISEAAENAMVGENFSVINSFVVIMTLIVLDILLSLWKRRWPGMDKWLEGLPTVIVENGRPLKDRMARARVDEQDILQAARERHGLVRLDQIKYAVLEVSGGISIIPASGRSQEG